MIVMEMCTRVCLTLSKWTCCAIINWVLQFFVCLLKKNAYFHEPVFCFPLVYLIEILQVISLWQTKDILLISPVDDICWDFSLLHHSGAALSTKKSETDGAGLYQQLAESAVHVMLEDPHDPISQGSKKVWAYGLWRRNPPHTPTPTPRSTVT